ncbi:MAG TPA: hypothetical protein VET26_01915 [Candidatus Sulfotelmatobacter sp.]|nr:hypothetical protein [Candidatus Sulfotelmatobacter sp.]
MDLLYVQLPGSPSWLVGYSWQGKPAATVHLKELDGHTDQLGSGIGVAPNGNGFIYGGAYTFDRLGHAVYQGQPAGKGSAPTMWSEDGQLLCGVEEQTSAVDSNGNGTADFYFVRRTPTGPAVRVVSFLHVNAIPGDMGYSAFACSHWLDRALLVRTVCCGIQGAIVVRISDGAILGRWDRDAGSPVFSPDGQEVADPTITADGKSVISTEVRLILGGTVLARYGPGVSFLGFSGDNRFAAATVTVAGGTQTEVIEVSTRRVVWRDPSNRPVARIVARPASGDLAIAFTAPPAQVPCPQASSSQCTNPLSNLVIVHPDGSSATLPGEFLVPMTWG